MKINIYSTPFCSHCKEVKEYLRANSLEFQEIDLTKPENKEILANYTQKFGVSSVPVIEIREDFVIGFNKEKLDTLINQK